MSDFPLGRREPTDWLHLEKFALTADTIPATPTPVVLGIPWYSNFDTSVRKDNRWWIGLSDNWGSIRGGHAICVEHGSKGDVWQWRIFYNQDRNSCVGFSESRMMSLLNRSRYDADWLYDEALKIDEWPGEADEGTSVRAGGQILLTRGHRRPGGTESLADGISAYRWAKTVDDVHAALKNPRADARGAVPLLNSWGPSYPERVWLPDAGLERLLAENGEAMLVTDR
jgi:hypothetical protein